MSDAVEQTGALLTADGVKLVYREWHVHRPRAALVLLHGLGEHSGRYAHVAARLNALGIAVRAPDARGHGRSGGARGTILRLDDPLTDLKLVFDDFARTEGKTPFLLGHSLGGLVAATFATSGLSPVRGLVLSSPALSLPLKRSQRLLLWCTGHLLPNLRLAHGLALDRLSHDPNVLASYRDDPLVHGAISPRLLRFMQRAIASSASAAARFTRPVLLQVAGQDALVDASASRAFMQRLPKGQVTLHWYDDAFHELYHETAERRGRVLTDLSRWLDAHIEQ